MNEIVCGQVLIYFCFDEIFLPSLLLFANTVLMVITIDTDIKIT